MSTVLWANVLANGIVDSDESDKYALYKYSRKLDKLSKDLGVIRFSSLQDFTDMQLNLSDEELPNGIKSTDELMAKNGVWVSGHDAAEMLEKLIDHISNNKIRFCILSNDSEIVVDELKESLTAANKAKSKNGKFNFSVVM